MTIYQKAIKVRKTCNNRATCKDCIYADKCVNTPYLSAPPSNEYIINIVQAIIKGKWKVN